ncbi:glycosyltransferase [Pseudodesulfovibrio cashew]|nr:glycosyltransferase family 2 protein [Pseudodesulfovibrio cashew]
MGEPAISFITYTYNDAAYAADLVRLAASFTVRPDEIVVVDDGSDTPFAMADAPDTLRIIRFEKNRGITAAKGAGLDAASGDILFSMDCDTRVNPDWLERALVHLGRPGVGLVGGSLTYRAGDDLVSRYLAHFGDNHNQRHVGPVDFVPGNAFVLRRETWEHAGGFLGYEETNCQDHYLCNRLKRLGYTLFSDARAEAWQLRRISRITLCKRVWKWCHKPIKQQLMEAAEADAPESGVVNYLFGVLAAPMYDRLGRIAELDEPLFHYVEQLYLAHAVLDCLDFLIWRRRAKPSMRRDFLAALAHLFTGYPRIWTLLRADLSGLGHDLRTGREAVDISRWDDLFLHAHPLRESGALAWLEDHGVVQLIREEIEEAYDFSSYDGASFAV